MPNPVVIIEITAIATNNPHRSYRRCYSQLALLSDFSAHYLTIELPLHVPAEDYANPVVRTIAKRARNKAVLPAAAPRAILGTTTATAEVALSGLAIDSLVSDARINGASQVSA